MKIITIIEGGKFLTEDFEGKNYPLEKLQEKVGGYVELAQRKVGRKYYDLWIHGEGRLIGLPPTLITENEDFRGNVVITRSKGERTIGLTEQEAEEVLKELEVVLVNDGRNLHFVMHSEKSFKW